MSKVKVLLEATATIYYRQVVEMDENDWATLDQALDEGDEWLATDIATELLDQSNILAADPLENVEAELVKEG